MSIARRYGRVTGNETETVSVSRKAPKSQSQSHGETDEIASLKARLAELERRVTELETTARAVTQPVTRRVSRNVTDAPIVTPTTTLTEIFGAETHRNAERQRRYRERKKAAQS